MRRLRSALAAALVAFAAVAPALGQGAPMFGGFLAEGNDPIEINANLLEWTERDGQDVFRYTGNVVARRGDMEIRAAVLVATQSPGGLAFDRIEATGNVSINSRSQRATADTAVMDMVGRTIVMTGNVSLTDGENRMSGQRLTIDLDTGGWRLETVGNERVQTVINPQPR